MRSGAKIAVIALAAMAVLVAGLLPAAAAPSAEEWASWKRAFLQDDGRVIDTGNGGISHSEGQAYGMMLAAEMNDRVAFARIWGFADRVLRQNGDPLMAWRYDPRRRPAIADPNNASDGDMMAAYALVEAYRAWGDRAHLDAAREIARALSDASIVSWRDREVLLPARSGFGAADRPDGPVVNLSYYVFETLETLETLAPGRGWAEMHGQGRAMIAGVLGAGRLPADWLSLPRALAPAEGFEPTFGYNNLRLPVYLARGGMAPETRMMMARLAERMGDAEGRLLIRDTISGAVRERLTEPGYRAVVALANCVAHGYPFPASARTFEPTSYYAATLHLLVLGHVREIHPECLE